MQPTDKIISITTLIGTRLQSTNSGMSMMNSHDLINMILSFEVISRDQVFKQKYQNNRVIVVTIRIGN